MDNSVIEQKLESLRRSLQRIKEKCPETVKTLQDDLDIQDIIVLNLTRAIQVCVDIGSHIIAQSEAAPPQTMGETFSILNKLGVLDKDQEHTMKKTVGFRNIAVHNYKEINMAIVQSICKNQLNDFEDFARKIIDYRHIK